LVSRFSILGAYAREERGGRNEPLYRPPGRNTFTGWRAGLSGRVKVTVRGLRGKSAVRCLFRCVLFRPVFVAGRFVDGPGAYRPDGPYIGGPCAGLGRRFWCVSWMLGVKSGAETGIDLKRRLCLRNARPLPLNGVDRANGQGSGTGDGTIRRHARTGRHWGNGRSIRVGGPDGRSDVQNGAWKDWR
jgi:hypothetical protein